MSGFVKPMEGWKDITIGALIAQAIGGGYLYLRSIGDKVSKREFEKAWAEMKTEHEKDTAALKVDIEKLNAELKYFARQASIDEVKADFRRLETKLDTKLDAIQQQLMTLLARDHK
jgi:hypothetical protein